MRNNLNVNTLFSKHRYVVAWGIITLCVIILKILEVGVQLENTILLSNTLDFSWTSDSVERLLHGYIAGRDFIFTYGPLFQITQSVPSLLFHYPSYVSPIISSILLQIPLSFFIFFLSQQVTQNKKDAFALFIMLVAVISLVPSVDPSNLLRIILPFIYAALYLRIKPIKNLFTVKSLSLLVIPSIVGLYSFDLFIICITFTILITIYDYVLTYRSHTHKNPLRYMTYIKILSIQLTIIMLYELGLSLLLSQNLQYLTSSIDTLRAYQYVMNIPFSLTKSLFMSIFFIIDCVLLWYIYRKKTITNVCKKVSVAFFFIAVIQLKAALIRSDESHIFIAFYPSLLLSVMFFFVLFRERIKHIAIYSACFLIFFLSIFLHSSSLFNHVPTKGLLKLINTSSSFSDIYTLPENYYFTSSEIKDIQNFISRHKTTTMIYPYDTYLLNTVHTTYPTYALQFYQYSASPVEQLSVEKLTKNPPQFIILGIDTKTAYALDDIPNFSRNPLLTKWMLENYSVFANKHSYLILKIDEAKKKNTIHKKDSSCDIYAFSTKNVMTSSLIENMIKTSTYYLNTSGGNLLRLPYSPYSQSITIIPSVTSPDHVAYLFSQSWNFTEDFTTTKKKLTIIKKLPIPKLKETLSGDIPTICYN